MGVRHENLPDPGFLPAPILQFDWLCEGPLVATMKMPRVVGAVLTGQRRTGAHNTNSLSTGATT